MALPIASHPTFSLVLPSTGQTVVFRPFLVKEEKILLIAQAGEDQTDMVRAIKQVIQNCIIEPKINVDSLTTFDLEYFFIKLRSRSVQNLVTLAYKDNEDGQIYNVEVDLDQVEVVKDDNVSNRIETAPGCGLLLKYPTMDILDAVEKTGSAADFSFAIIQACLEAVYDENNVYKFADYTREEVEQYVNELDIKTYKAIQQFIEAMPRIEHVIGYTNSNGKKVNITLRSLTDFFTLG
jgi:hypothetical protein